MGQDGFRVTSMDGGVKDVKNYVDQLTMHKQHNKEQAMEDSKILATQVGMTRGHPNSETQGVFGYQYYDQNYVQAVDALDKTLNKAITPRDMKKDDIRENARTKALWRTHQSLQDSWETRVSEHTSQYELWKDSPRPQRTLGHGFTR